MFLHAWLIYPVVLVLVAWGCGLLLRRAPGSSMPPALIVPGGFAALVVVGTVLTFADATAELAAPAMALLALAGFLLAWRGDRGVGERLRPARAWAAPTVAALLPAVAIVAPVIVTGQPGFTGYARIVDLAFQLELAQQFVTDGRAISQSVTSSYEDLIARTLDSGYPGGAQAVLGATSQLAGIDPIWAWQGFLAFLGALLGLALWALLGHAIAWRPGRAVAAGVAAQPTILYAYGITGGVKELAAAALVALSAVLLTTSAQPGSGTSAGPVPILVAVVAGVATFTLGIVPWVAVLLVVALGLRILRTRRLPRFSARASAALVVSTGVAAIPLALAAIKVAPLLSGGGPTDLGNLVAPVPAWAAIGPWLTPDHRFPLEAAGTQTPTAILAVGVLALALGGLARAVGRRDGGLIAAASAGAIGLALVFWRGNPWVELKAITTTAPLGVALAFAGAAALARYRRSRPLALPAGVFVAIAVLAGNALVYHGTSLAPYDRLVELQDIGRRHAGEGPALHPVFEEYAEYLLRDLEAVGLTNPISYLSDLRPEAPPLLPLQFTRDLDEFPLPALERWKLIVLRRDPTASRPPSDFRLSQRTRHYDVWERRADGDVVVHEPLGPRFGERDRAVCRRLEASLLDAGPRAVLAYAPVPPGMLSLPFGASRLWLDPGGGQRLMRGPGSLRYAVSAPSTGRYALWLSGSFGRAVTVSVDGRDVRRLRWQGNYPLQYEPVAKVHLQAGQHLVEVTRGGGSLLPATSNELRLEGTTTRVGPVILAPVDPPRPVLIAPRGKVEELCASDEEWDWAEVVVPTDASAPR